MKIILTAMEGEKLEICHGNSLPNGVRIRITEGEETLSGIFEIKGVQAALVALEE